MNIPRQRSNNRSAGMHVYIHNAIVAVLRLYVHQPAARAGCAAWLCAGASFIISSPDSPASDRAMRRNLLALLICALVMPAAAMAQLRQIPDFAMRGSMTHVRDTIVAVDGKQMRLSAGAQIRSPENLIIVPVSLPPGALVKCTLDGAGQIHGAWALTPTEAAARDQKPQ